MFVDLLVQESQTRFCNKHYHARLIKLLRYCLANPVEHGVKHHIMPKSKSWSPEHSKDPLNLVCVTPKMHFVIHHLMWKAFPKDPAMYTAFWNMCHLNRQRISATVYSTIRELHCRNMRDNNPAKRPGAMDSCRGELNPAKRPDVRKKISEARLGKPVSAERREKQRVAMKGKRTGTDNPFYGKTHTEEVKQQLRELAAQRPADYYKKLGATLALRPKLTCPHCQLLVDERNAKRWHFDRCRSRP